MQLWIRCPRCGGRLPVSEAGLRYFCWACVSVGVGAETAGKPIWVVMDFGSGERGMVAARSYEGGGIADLPD